jgi:hypothetical protein
MKIHMYIILIIVTAMRFWLSNEVLLYRLVMFGEHEEPFAEEYETYEDVMDAYAAQCDEPIVSLPCFIQGLRYALSDAENDTMTVTTWVREYGHV